MEIIKPKYSENPQENFEWFCYLLFCREYNKPNGILRYKNQSGIETNPIELNDKIIGWQSKFYEGKLSTHKDDLIGTLEKSKRDYPKITKIIFYTNLEWTQVHKKKGTQAEKSQAQIDSEKKADDLNIEIEWRTASYFESEFVSMTHKDISKYFFIYDEKEWTEGIIVNNGVKGVVKNDGTVNQTIVDGDNNNITIIHESKKSEKPLIQYEEALKEKYKTVKELKKAIFSYYPTYGLNINDFRKADTFNELFEIFKREEECLYCILKELKREYNFFEKYKNTDCENLKQKSELSTEINRLIIRIDVENNDLKNCKIDGYIGFSSEIFEPIEVKHLNLSSEDYSKILFEFIDFILKGRSCSRIIELQLLLANQLFELDFQFSDKRIKIMKRLLIRIENYTQLDMDKIKFWKNNSDFYKNNKFQNICQDSICSLNENELSDFRQYDDDKHICVVSDHCLSQKIQDIYNYGVPMVLYSHQSSCTIINVIDFQQKEIKSIKNIVFRFMDKNKSTHFIYDDYNDLEFLKIEGAEDDYI